MSMKESKSSALLTVQNTLSHGLEANHNPDMLNQQLLAFINEKENINRRLMRNPSGQLPGAQDPRNNINIFGTF